MAWKVPRCCMFLFGLNSVSVLPSYLRAQSLAFSEIEITRGVDYYAVATFRFICSSYGYFHIRMCLFIVQMVRCTFVMWASVSKIYYGFSYVYGNMHMAGIFWPNERVDIAKGKTGFSKTMKVDTSFSENECLINSFPPVLTHFRYHIHSASFIFWKTKIFW